MCVDRLRGARSSALPRAASNRAGATTCDDRGGHGKGGGQETRAEDYVGDVDPVWGLLGQVKRRSFLLCRGRGVCAKRKDQFGRPDRA